MKEGLTRIPRAKSDSLYAQLGGYDRLVRVLDGISGRLMRDERLKLFFAGHNDTSKVRLKQRFIDFICADLGGPVHSTAPISRQRTPACRSPPPISR